MFKEKVATTTLKKEDVINMVLTIITLRKNNLSKTKTSPINKKRICQGHEESQEQRLKRRYKSNFQTRNKTKLYDSKTRTQDLRAKTQDVHDKHEDEYLL
jgi:hypothetical protein